MTGGCVVSISREIAHVRGSAGAGVCYDSSVV